MMIFTRRMLFWLPRKRAIDLCNDLDWWHGHTQYSLEECFQTWAYFNSTLRTNAYIEKIYRVLGGKGRGQVFTVLCVRRIYRKISFAHHAKKKRSKSQNGVLTQLFQVGMTHNGVSLIDRESSCDSTETCHGTGKPSPRNISGKQSGENHRGGQDSIHHEAGG